jgi:Family of unknown function (DUF6504)
MLRVNEFIEVSVNQTGEPIGFSWRGDSYLVVSRPVRWFARREWWRESDRAYRGIGAEVVEMEMWRLNAGIRSKGGLTSTQNAAQFELVRGSDAPAVPGSPSASGKWRLVRVFA